DLTLDLLGAGTRVLSDDLDDGRGGVRIGLHVDVGEGVRPHHDERHSEEDHHDWVVESPDDQVADHRRGDPSFAWVSFSVAPRSSCRAALSSTARETTP